MTKIYFIDLSKNNFSIEYLENNLPNNCLERCKKYKIKDDYLRSLTGWYLINKYLYDDFKIQLNEYSILLDGFDKPYIKSNIYFNISHSNNIVCVVISDKNCGIDVELVRKINNKDLLCKKFGYENLSDDEIIKEWTKREAFGKMIGKGVFFGELKKTAGSNIITKEIFDNIGNKYYLSYSFDELIFEFREV